MTARRLFDGPLRGEPPLDPPDGPEIPDEILEALEEAEQARLEHLLSIEPSALPEDPHAR